MSDHDETTADAADAEAVAAPPPAPAPAADDDADAGADASSTPPANTDSDNDGKAPSDVVDNASNADAKHANGVHSQGRMSETVEVVALSGGGDTSGDVEKGAGNAKPKPVGRERWERWAVLAIVSVGALLASIQSSALIIAFPTLIVQLEADIDTILWVLLSFLLVVSAIVPIVGKLGDVVGQAILYNIGFGIFTLASFLSGFSQESAHGDDLIFYRCLLGIGGSFLFTNSAAIITNAFAPYNQVGVSQGVFQLAFALGSVLGPVVGGGFAVTNWRWIFWFNAPIGFVCTIGACFLVRDGEAVRKALAAKRQPWYKHVRDFDLIGSFLIIVAILLLMLALTQAVIATPGLSSTAGLTCLIVFGVLALVLFAVNENYAKNPLMPGRIWKSKVFSLSTASATLMGFARANVTYTLIFFLQGPYGEDPLTAGLQLIPLGLGILIVGFPAGRIADKYGVRNLATLGCVVVLAGLIGLAFIKPTTNYWLIALALLVVGFGNGFFNAPNGLAGMTSVLPQDRGVAAAIRLLFAFVPQMIGIVIVFAFILNSLTYQELLILFIYGGGGLSPAAIDSFMTAYQNVYWITIATTAVAALLSALIPGSFNPADAVRAAQKQAAAAAKPAPMQTATSSDVLVAGASSARLDTRPSEAVLSGMPTADVELAILNKTAGT